MASWQNVSHLGLRTVHLAAVAVATTGAINLPAVKDLHISLLKSEQSYRCELLAEIRAVWLIYFKSQTFFFFKCSLIH